MPLVLVVFVSLFFSLLSEASSGDEVMLDDPLSVCFEQLKMKYMPLVSSKYPVGMPPLDESDLIAIEPFVSLGFRFRDDLRRFYLEVSHLAFKGTAPSRAHGGLSSSLCQLVRTRYKADGWIPFCDDGDGYYGINQEEGCIRLFSYSADSIFGEEAYTNLEGFLKAQYLSD